LLNVLRIKSINWGNKIGIKSDFYTIKKCNIK